MVQVQQLTKSYGSGSAPAVDGVTFSVLRGELFGLIGPDGAGKTSLFRMLATLLLPDSGNAIVGGFDVVSEYRQIRASLGYMPGRFSLYPDLSVEENLDFFATLFNTTVRENYHLVKDIYVQLEPFRKRKAAQLSGGMKQKLALCCALIHQPKVLLLDEPTTGVDPVSRKEFWDMLKRLREQEITIIVSTPYMDEASRCDRVALIQQGSILEIGTPSHIISTYPHALVAFSTRNVPALLRELKESPEVLQAYAAGEFVKVALRSVHDLESLTIRLRSAGIDLPARLSEPDIEDCFIELMKNAG